MHACCADSADRHKVGLQSRLPPRGEPPEYWLLANGYLDIAVTKPIVVLIGIR